MSYAQAAASGPKQTPEEPPRLEESVASTSSLVDVDSPHVSSVPSDYEYQSIKTTTQADRIEREEESEASTAEAKEEEAKKKARLEKNKARSKARSAKKLFGENCDNPVLVGNAAVYTLSLGVLGVAAYKRVLPDFNWKVAGVWAGALGLFATADYYVSKYFFTKYPPKN
ncbi:MAG: hypothetical protein M1834_009193 [Cirrosporium novae-zelandiae]|nr:MAG: hypothetical protein M1834_009193 [Cirrosporium novae-zelandiae]